MHGDGAEDVDGLLAEIDDAIASGRSLAVLDGLLERAGAVADGRVDHAAIRLRHAAFEQLDRTPGRPAWPASFEDPFPGLTTIPTISPDQLDGEVLGGALVHHGCLRVDGLLTDADAAALRERIDEVFAARDAAVAGAPLEGGERWFAPFEVGARQAQIFNSEAFVRTVDSPGAVREVAALFERTGVTRTVTEYFRERPVMIANKWVLRLSPTGKLTTDFHQDGAFLGKGIRTVNCWIPLSPCGPGTGKPAMDLVPRRYPAVLPSDGAAFDWGCSEQVVLEAAGAVPLASPTFAPGDALFFDELLPHRTSVGLDLTERYAMESWFAAASYLPRKQIPVVL